MKQTNRCFNCGFHDEDYGCTCSDLDKWYACPIESEKPENVQELKDYAEWSSMKNKEINMRKARYKLIVVIGYKELHFEFAYLPNIDNFIELFYTHLVLDEEDAKEVRMSIIVVPDNTVTAEDESED